MIDEPQLAVRRLGVPALSLSHSSPVYPLSFSPTTIDTRFALPSDGLLHASVLLSALV